MQSPTKNGNTKPPRRKRAIVQLDSAGRGARTSNISSVEHDDLVRRRLQRFMDEDSGRVAPLHLTQQMDLVQAFGRCREWMTAAKKARPHEPVVWVVNRMNLLTLSLCQDMDLPLFMGGEGQAPRDDTGDCVWLYNWAPGRFFCGNPECGQLIVTSLRHFYCDRCHQVQYCARPECALKGGALHHSKCSGSPQLPSCSYFMDKFLVSTVAETNTTTSAKELGGTAASDADTDEGLGGLLSVEEYVGRCFDAEDFGVSAEDLEMFDGDQEAGGDFGLLAWDEGMAAPLAFF